MLTALTSSDHPFARIASDRNLPEDFAIRAPVLEYDCRLQPSRRLQLGPRRLQPSVTSAFSPTEPRSTLFLNVASCWDSIPLCQSSPTNPPVISCWRSPASISPDVPGASRERCSSSPNSYPDGTPHEKFPLSLAFSSFKPPSVQGCVSTSVDSLLCGLISTSELRRHDPRRPGFGPYPCQDPHSYPTFTSTLRCLFPLQYP